jgi:transposase-like protein
MRKPWTPELDARLIALREGGHSITEIAKAMERSRGSISSRMTKLGLFDKSKNRPWTPGETDHLIAHYREPEWPAKRLAEHYDRTSAAVRMRAAYLGIQRPEIDYKAKPNEMDQRIVTLAMGDVPSGEIAEQVGCSPAYVWVVMKKRPTLHRQWKRRLGIRRRKSEYHQGGARHG